MSFVKEYVEDWIGYWAYVGQRSMDAWYVAARSARGKDERPLDGLWLTALDYWTDIAAASLVAWRGPDRRPTTVVFALDVMDTDVGPKTIPVFGGALPYTDPRVVWIGRISGERQGRELHAGCVSAKFVDDRAGLQISVSTAADPARPAAGPEHPDEPSPLAEAVYRALVVVDDLALVEAIIDVGDRGYPPTTGEYRAQFRSTR